MKNKLKPEILNGKEIYKLMFFSVMTKNLNWEISTKNLVTFKRWDGVNDENFLNYWSTLRNLNFREGGEGA